MKNTDKINLLIALVVLTIIFSVISMIASPESIRYSWSGINPWNSVKGVPLTLNRFLDLGPWIVNTLSALIIGYLWWRIYALIKKIRKNRDAEE